MSEKVIKKFGYMQIYRIVNDEDWLLLYGGNSNYHVIARQGADLHSGDYIRYEPSGDNFGFFKEKINRYPCRYGE